MNVFDSRTTAVFYLPRIHERPTGGNIYNRRIVDALQQRIAVQVDTGEELEIAAIGGRAARSTRIGIVDSLLVPTEVLERVDPGLDQLVLLVHYLDLLDPARAEGEKARQERQLLSLFDGFACTSRYVATRLYREGVEGDRVFLLRPGLDDRFRRPVQRNSRDVPNILTVASLVPGKGLREGIEMFELLSDRPWRWRIVGDDTLDRGYASRLRGRIARSDLREQIDLVGPVSSTEIARAYAEADLFFLPSRFETCSMVTMEAMARGLPVVAYDVGGIDELVCDGMTGYLVRRGETYAAAGYVRFLLEYPRQRVQMGKAARRASRAFESWDATVDRFYQMLETLRGRSSM